MTFLINKMKMNNLIPGFNNYHVVLESCTVPNRSDGIPYYCTVGTVRYFNH